MVSSGAVPAWSIGEVKCRCPQLTPTSNAPLVEVLILLEAGLREASFRVKERRPTGLRARYIDWMDVVADGINRTTVEAEAASGAEPVEMVVTARTFDAGRGGPKKIARGLSVTVDALRARGLRAEGHEVTTTPWAVPEERKKGKRR
ncbi:MAG: hypothetical protein JWO76_1925 [Nocardioides sp.]|nr:hypothetical protein [Nocardioides sp.]